MAYRITYEWQKEHKLIHNRKRPAAVYLSILLAASILAVRLLIPESGEVFQELLHPLTDEVAAQAFAEFVSDIEAGTPFAEAAEVFCGEIIANGGQ